jgi:hypothetical protein
MSSNMSVELKNPKTRVSTSNIVRNSRRLDFCTIAVSVSKRVNIPTVRDNSTAVGYVECNLEEF